jgi:hypothetical protein
MRMSFDHTGNGILVSSSLVCLLGPAVAADSMPTSSAKFCCSSLFICPESANMDEFSMHTSDQILPKSQLIIQTKVEIDRCPLKNYLVGADIRKEYLDLELQDQGSSLAMIKRNSVN